MYINSGVLPPKALTYSRVQQIMYRNRVGSYYSSIATCRAPCQSLVE